MTRYRDLSPSARVKASKAAEALKAGEFIALCRHFGLEEPTREYGFSFRRAWRFDFAWWCDCELVAIEVQGGVWTRGAHGRGSGIMRDMEKHNAATALGWRVFYVTPQQLCTLDTIKLMADALRVTLTEST